MVSWLLANDIDINNLPPLKYNHGIDETLMSYEDRNKMIRQEIWQIYTRFKWITPREPLPSKMLYYKELLRIKLKCGLVCELTLRVNRHSKGQASPLSHHYVF